MLTEDLVFEFGVHSHTRHALPQPLGVTYTFDCLVVSLARSVTVGKIGEFPGAIRDITPTLDHHG